MAARRTVTRILVASTIACGLIGALATPRANAAQVHRGGSRSEGGYRSLFLPRGTTTPWAPAASGASNWKIQPMPSPTVPHGVLVAESCPTPSACFSVGTYVDRAGTVVTLAEGWDGSRWNVKATADPSGAVDSRLTGVSCQSADACVAVGYYLTAGDTVLTLVEAWDGSTWTMVPSPNPAGSDAAGLFAVSCSSATDCTAVGDDNEAGTPLTLVEVWHGAGWSIVHSPNEPGSVANGLFGVSCAASTACTAVGATEGSSEKARTLAEVWTGHGWHHQDTPNPIGSSGLSSISCASPGICVAVGSYGDALSGANVSLAESSDGNLWALDTVPLPAGTVGSAFESVSCVAGGSCTAVGNYEKSSHPNKGWPLAESWNGTAWAVETVPIRPGSSTSFFEAVSCLTMQACGAVGTYSHGATSIAVVFAESWDGSTWSLQSSRSPAGAALTDLEAVSCPSSNACIAVGSFSNPAGVDLTMVLYWDGATWKLHVPASPPGSRATELTAVSCISAVDCVAVGSFLDSSRVGQMLAESWNGSSWTVQPTPNPAGAMDSTLSGVSCDSADTCVAVGSYADANGTGLSVAESWDGTSWSLGTVPSPDGAGESRLAGVSCLSVTSCIAVGSYADSDGQGRPLAELWDGTSWTVMAVPSPHAATFSVLSSVSCTASWCAAVGIYGSRRGEQKPLAEIWDGTSWQVQSVPAIAGVIELDVSSVSCASSSACSAAGFYLNAQGLPQSLVEGWNGHRWSLQLTPAPAGSVGVFLRSVSCTSGDACTAVGTNETLSGIGVNLAITN